MNSSRIIWILVIVALALVAYAYYVTGGDTSGDSIWAKIVLLVKQIASFIILVLSTINSWLDSTLGISFAGIGAWIAGVLVKLWNLLVAAVGWTVSKIAGVVG